MALRSASVCVIIRQTGPDKEVLLIKRTIRATDLWSGHIAVPGGHREAGESDLDAAVREAYEEVGIDLAKSADLVNTLEPRRVQPVFSKRALRICPYVFLVRPESAHAELIPQPGEVAAAFWYPMHKLLDADARTTLSVDAGSRVNANTFVGSLVKRQLGAIEFEAIDIWPGEVKTVGGDEVGGAQLPEVPWKLWGLTLQVMTEVLSITYRDANITPLQTPSFSAWDMRIYHNLLSTLVQHLNLGGIPADQPEFAAVGRVRERLIPYVFGLGMAGRLLASIAALMQIYRRLFKQRL